MVKGWDKNYFTLAHGSYKEKQDVRLSISLEYGNNKGDINIWMLKAIELLILKFKHPLIPSIEMYYLGKTVFYSFSINLLEI